MRLRKRLETQKDEPSDPALSNTSRNPKNEKVLPKGLLAHAVEPGRYDHSKCSLSRCDRGRLGPTARPGPIAEVYGPP